MKQIRNYGLLLSIFIITLSITTCSNASFVERGLFQTKSETYSFTIEKTNPEEEVFPYNCFDDICVNHIHLDSFEVTASGIQVVYPYQLQHTELYDSGQWGDSDTYLEFDGSSRGDDGSYDIRFEYDPEEDDFRINPMNGTSIYRLDNYGLEEGITCETNKMMTDPIYSLETGQGFCGLSSEGNTVVFFIRVIGDESELFNIMGIQVKNIRLEVPYRSW